MAAPYRANHQHKVKAHTSEASKRYRAKLCRSGMLCTAFVAKNVWAFWRRSLFLFK